MKKIIVSTLAALIGTTALLGITSFANADESNSAKTTYINGGVGENEEGDIRSLAGDYNLRLFLSESKNGNFVSNVHITISDKKGKVLLDIPNGGPMLFVNVKNDSYTIVAQRKGVTITRKVDVPNHRGTNVFLNWKTTADSTETEPMDK
jgi:hypothetical protein